MRPYNMMESKVLLFIHAAYEDNNFGDSERTFIQKKFSSTNIDHIIDEYQELDPGTKIEIITDLVYDMVNNENSFGQLRNELMQLFAVDGDISRFEKAFLGFLDKMQRAISISGSV